MAPRSLLVAVPAALVLLSSCAPNGASAGVAAVATERTAVATSAEPTVPVVIDIDRRIPEMASEPESLADEVDTLVETSTPRPSSVAVVGDSLTLSAEDEIMRALVRTGLHVVAIDGVESRRMTQGSTSLPPGTEAVEQIMEGRKPGIWVIALGTNDVASVESLDGFRAEIREVLDLIPPDDPVIWVDLWIRDREESISHANQLIRAELRLRRGGTAVVDWYAHGDQEGVITGDGVHLTGTGQQLFADSIASAIDELFDT